MTILRCLTLCALALALGACSLPRGAAIQNEVIRNQDAEDAPFEVVSINRSNVAALQGWPVTGWAGHYHWFQAGQGPKTNVIRTGDIVDLVIWDNQENSLLTAPEQKNVGINGLVVAPDGTIFVPFLNAVDIRGKTPEAARAQIARDLQVVVPDAQVQLTVVSGPDNSVDAVAGFANAGTYPLPNRNYSILSLISAAGGLDPDLENPLVRLIRDGRSFEIRADTLFETPSANVVLRGGDKIIAQEDERYFVGLGATGREAIVPFDREEITAIEALALLGGLTDARADPRGVLILREFPSEALRTDGRGPAKNQVVFSIDLTSADGLFSANNFEINPRDLVVATESPVTNVRTILGLLGASVGFVNIVTN